MIIRSGCPMDCSPFRGTPRRGDASKRSSYGGARDRPSGEIRAPLQSFLHLMFSGPGALSVHSATAVHAPECSVKTLAGDSCWRGQIGLGSLSPVELAGHVHTQRNTHTHAHTKYKHTHTHTHINYIHAHKL
jgi:hypothetical protein